MMRFGGVRPPSPMTSGAIVAVWSLGVALAPLISVTERLSGPQLGALNSATGPLNVTTVSFGGFTLGRNRKMPSDVRTSPSGWRSCTQMPFGLEAMTTPGTPPTMRPSQGERCWAPWMSWIRRPSRATVEKLMSSSRSSACAWTVQDPGRRTAIVKIVRGLAPR
jgi:hypothetical protein